MTQLKRTAAVARAYGVACDVISAARSGRPVAGHAHRRPARARSGCPATARRIPTDLTQALARGARHARRAHRRSVTSTRVTRKTANARWRARGQRPRLAATRTARKARIGAEVVVNCAGQWAKPGRAHVRRHRAAAFGRALCTSSPRRLPACIRDLPVMRDPDGFIYFKEEVGGLVMGGFEPEAKPWGMNGIPETFEFGNCCPTTGTSSKS
jgi:hypothetical protein